jgi:ADP-heptose:LPS heptosyltransferase
LIIQLGGKEEVIVDGTTPLAGRLGLRESMACLASAKVFVGPDSFLMHAARGLQIPSIIILGGRLKPEHIGYSQNRNLYVAEDCGPCGLLGPCGHGVKCMDKIKPQLVLRCIEQALGTP